MIFDNCEYNRQFDYSCWSKKTWILPNLFNSLLELDELESDTATTKAIREVLKNFLSFGSSKNSKSFFQPPNLNG